MTARRTRSGLLIASTLALTLAVAGCNSDGSSTASGAGASATTSASAAAKPLTVAAAFDKVAAATSRSKSVKGTLSTQTSKGAVEGDFAYKFSANGLQAAFSFDQGGKTFKGILTPKAMYLGGADLPLPGGKKYLKISLGDDNPLAKTYADLAKNFSSSGDLGSQVAQWKSLSNLHEAGTETIDGVTATKYTGSVDPATPPAGASTTAKKAFATAAKLGITSIDTTIWIGPDGLPLKVESATTGGEGPTTTTIKYTDWGAAVDVAIPPASEVTDLSALLSR